MNELEHKQRMMLDVMSTHANNLYSSLIYESNLSSNNLKEMEFEEVTPNGKEPMNALRGYFARKDRRKYFLDGEYIDMLPIRVGPNVQELIDKDDVILRPLAPTPFKLLPEGKMLIRELMDALAPFEHDNPPEWMLLKFIAVAAYVGRTYVCLATTSSFGKSSVFDLIHYLTDKSPVFKPRSVPGVLNHINGTGNMVFDETHRCKKDVRDIIEEFALQIGGGKSTYLNGALKSGSTKERYDCTLQSITFLYNLVGNYQNAEKDYFEFIFSNNKAIEDRFLKFRFDGTLTEKWNKEFNIPKVAEDNKMFYINFAKTLLFMQKIKQENSVNRKWNYNKKNKLSSRQKMSYDNITWVIDMYCESQAEFDDYVGFLNESIIDYKDMIAPLFNHEPASLSEEEMWSEKKDKQ